MKRTISIVIVVAAAIIVAGGIFYYANRPKENNTTANSQQNEASTTGKKDVRDMVWQQLSVEQKESIDGTWEDAKVSKIIFRSSMGAIEDKSYEGKEVLMIDFPTKGDPQGNMIVYADVDTFKYIGNGFID